MYKRVKGTENEAIFVKRKYKLENVENVSFEIMAGDFNRTINRLIFVIIVIYKKYSITYDIV